MTTIYSINADRQERYDTVAPERVAKTINILKRKGQLKITVIKKNNHEINTDYRNTCVAGDNFSTTMASVPTTIYHHKHRLI